MKLNQVVEMEQMENIYLDLLKSIGEDTSREGLQETPRRAAKAFQFLTKGYNENVDEVINGAVFESEMDEIVLVKNIELYSMCEHHLLPFIGKCHVGYLPNGKILGLSKVARVVDVFARRLQIQEKLTQQIADAIMSAVNAAGVAVVIEAQHLCMMMRGVEKQNSSMVTSCVLGMFRENLSTREEFFSLLK